MSKIWWIGGVLVVFLFKFSHGIHDLPCRNLDIRNTVQDMEAQLRNCTVVYGYLQLVLIQDPRNNFTGVSFPELREITGFLMMFSVRKVISVGDLFPNLTVIRGAVLFANYALIIYGLPSLETISLKNLLLIERGYVRIENNPVLCYADTIDWNIITKMNDTATSNFVNNTLDKNITCPKTNVCVGCDIPFCWHVKSCQKVEGIGLQKMISLNCHKECLGKCVNNTASGCYVCRNVSYHGECLERCPYDTVLNKITNRCLTVKECNDTKGIAFRGECLSECPVGYEKKMRKDLYLCIMCKNKNCGKTCSGIMIEFLSNVQRMRGCTKVHGSLVIKMSSDIDDIARELEFYLGDIEEITGFLKVVRSPSITSLNFLKKLRVIHGEKLEMGFAVLIHGNPNLQVLIDLENRDPLVIKSGSMSIHYNHKLCMSKIKHFRDHSRYNNSKDVVSLDSNGQREVCDVVIIRSDYDILSWQNVTVYWEKFNSEKYENVTGAVKGYIIYYIESQNENMTWYDGRESCSKFSWRSIYLEHVDQIPYDDIKEMYHYNITGLRQMTRYAFYVRSLQDDRENIVNGQSVVKTFKMPIHVLSSPIVSTVTKEDRSVTLTWKVFVKETPFIEFYSVDILHIPDNKALLDQRNYCIYPTQPEEHTNRTEACRRKVIEESELDVECNCYLDEGDEDLNILRDNRYKNTKEIMYFGALINCEVNKHHNACEAYQFGRFKRQLLNFEREDLKRPEHMIQKRNIASSKNYVTTLIIEKNLTEYKITDLKPYTNYAFQFFACNTKTLCSPYYLHTERTKADKDIDNIDTNQTFTYELHYDTVSFTFYEPKDINSIIVAYKIEVKTIPIVNGTTFFNKTVSHTYCVSRPNHEKQKHSFVMDKLSPNMYGFRAQAISLANTGSFSEFQYITLLGPTFLQKHLKLVLSLGFVLVIAILISISAYKNRRFFCSRRSTGAGAGEHDDLANLIQPSNSPEDEGTEMSVLSSSRSGEPQKQGEEDDSLCNVSALGVNNSEDEIS